MADRNYIDPKGYWGDPEGKIHRMGNEDGEQEVIATVTPACSEAEWKLLCNVMNAANLRGPESSRN